VPASHVDRAAPLCTYSRYFADVTCPIPGGCRMALVRVLGPLVLAGSDHHRGGRCSPLASCSHPP
jgi:hypothetical protein